MLSVTSACALAQFRPGRIDHHNAQILCAVAGLMFLARSLEDERAGWIAGALIGLGLAIGYEAIALVVPALGLAAMVALWERAAASAGVARAATAAAGVLLAALVVTVPPSRWLDVHCDALSSTCRCSPAAARRVCGLRCTCRIAWRALGRLGVAGLCAALASALYAGLEPACLRGRSARSIRRSSRSGSTR